MTNKEDNNVVALRDGKWWAISEKHRYGPYDTEEQATAAAVRRAKTFNGTDTLSKVWVDVPGDGMPEVYSSED